MNPKITRLDYCQFLLSSQTNYTLTYFADHVDKWSHDIINRYLRGDRIPPRLVWDNVQPDVVLSPQLCSPSFCMDNISWETFWLFQRNLQAIVR